MSTTTSKAQSLRLLSIDNGLGIRGMSPLLILRHILLNIQQKEGLPDIPRPCDIFDLAGGSGTGGIIVIMLFRLQMSIDAAIKAYLKLSEYVFSEKKWFFQEGTFKATRLEEEMLSIIQQSEGGYPGKVLLLNEQGPKCFVSAMYPHERGVGFPTFFCSWESKIRNDLFNLDCSVVEAVRATTAVPNFFKPARVGHVITTSYFNIKLRNNNPTQYVIDMARELYGDRQISCLMSLGTGQTDVFGPCARLPLRSTGTYRRWLPKKLLRALQDVITDCEQKSMDMRREIRRHLSPILYIRFNNINDNSLGPLEPLDEWRTISLHDHTTSYLVETWHPGYLDRLLQGLKWQIQQLPKMTIFPWHALMNNHIRLQGTNEDHSDDTVRSDFKPRKAHLHENAEKNLITATFEFPGVLKEKIQISVSLRL